MTTARLVLGGLLLAASAASAQGLFDDNEARRRIATLRSEVEANHKALNDRLSGIEAAVQDKRAIVELATLIDELRQEIARMRGQNEVLLNRSDNLERRQKDLYVDLDNRLRKMETSQAQLEQQLQSQLGQIQDRLAQPERAAAAEKQAYEAALNQFKLGNYGSSIAAFQSFMSSYPASELVPSAQYWVGNGFYAMRDYKSAIAAQQKILSAWPDNAKAPDAMWNIASSQTELGDVKSARETLKTLASRYPQSPLAEQARQRLAGRR
jgi:tol-pal system protein YbgF